MIKIIYIVGFVLLIAVVLMILMYKTPKNPDRLPTRDDTDTSSESYKRFVDYGEQDTVDRVTTLWDIENETHTINDRDRHKRDLSSVITAAMDRMPHILLQYNNNYINKLSDLINIYGPVSDIVGISNLSEFDKSENGNGTFSNSKICPKMIEFHTSLEFMSMDRNKFKLSTHPDSIIYYSSEPATIDEKQYYLLIGGKKHTSDSYYEDATLLVTRVVRIVDNREFYYAHFRQRFKQSFVNQESFLQVLRAINTINERHVDLPIIFSGTLNVEFDYGLLRQHFPYHHICDFRNNETFISFDERIVNDFVIVSRSLYDRIEYSANFVDTYNRNENSLIAKCLLYRTHNKPGVYKIKRTNETDNGTVVGKDKFNVNLFNGLTTTDTMARIIQSRNTLIQPTAPLITVTTDDDEINDADSAGTIDCTLPKISKEGLAIQQQPTPSDILLPMGPPPPYEKKSKKRDNRILKLFKNKNQAQDSSDQYEYDAYDAYTKK